MKKLLVILAACLLVFGVAGQANAYFYNSGTADLIRVVYQTTASGGTLEEATDLGSITSIENNPSSLNDAGYNLSTGDGTNKISTSASNLIVAYFASNGTTPSTATEYWTSSINTTATNPGYNSFANGVWTATHNVLTNYSSIASGASNVWETFSSTGGTSYYFKMDKGGLAPGSFDQYTANVGETALVSGGSVSEYLFAWTSPKTNMGNTLAELQLVTTFSNGTISTSVSQVAATPISTSVLLFGSGLLGLIGVVRRKVV